MEVSLISDTIATVAAAHGLGFARFILDRQPLTVSSDHSSPAGTLQISSLVFLIDAVAPPPVKSNYVMTAPRSVVCKRRRTKRRSKTEGGGADDGEYGGFFDGDGPFGGGGGGGGGGNFDGFGWFGWEESSSDSSYDPAFDFVYEVLCWVVFSNCLHFAFKKVVRILADGFADAGRDKVPMRFTPIC